MVTRSAFLRESPRVGEICVAIHGIGIGVVVLGVIVIRTHYQSAFELTLVAFWSGLGKRRRRVLGQSLGLHAGSLWSGILGILKRNDLPHATLVVRGVGLGERGLMIESCLGFLHGFWISTDDPLLVHLKASFTGYIIIQAYIL